MVLLSRLLAAVHGTFTHKSSNNSDIDLIVADRAADRCCMLLLGFALLLLLWMAVGIFCEQYRCWLPLSAAEANHKINKILYKL